MSHDALPLDVLGVIKRYGRITAVDDLTFSLERGSITGFLGPNGAGKTTTLRMVGGLLRPTAGLVRLFGEDAARPQARRRLGYMPADPAFLSHLSGRANLDLLAELHGGASVATTRATTATALDLSPDDLGRAVGGYSSGMRQKLAIVAALQHDPDLVVLDEPANRLDPLAHHAFCRVLRERADGGTTVLLSSHVLAEVEAVCDSVLLIREGRLLTAARVNEVRDHAARIVTLTYQKVPATTPHPLADAQVRGRVITGRIPAGRPDVLRELLSEGQLTDITVAPVSLEEVVLDLYAGGEPQ